MRIIVKADITHCKQISRRSRYNRIKPTASLIRVLVCGNALGTISHETNQNGGDIYCKVALRMKTHKRIYVNTKSELATCNGAA